MANNSNRKAIEFMVQGALPPHSTNVLWMDTSVTTLPVLKIFENGAWTTVHTEDSKSVELLAETVLAQQKEIAQLTNSIETKIDGLQSTVAKDSTVAKEATLGAVGLDAAAAKTAAQGITGYALQGGDPTATNTAILQAIPNVSGLATETNATLNKNAIIAEIIANAGVPTMTIPNTTASKELAPNTLYVFVDRTTDLTLMLGTPIAGKANEYHCFIVVGSAAPTITWPTGISWNGGSAPTVSADKTYEVSILNNVAAYFEV